MLSQSYKEPKTFKHKYVRARLENADLDKLLDIGDVPPIPEPEEVNEPIERILRRTLPITEENSPEILDDIFADLLAESQAKLAQFQRLLPSQMKKLEESSEISKDEQPEQIGKISDSAKINQDADEVANETTTDPLACHADTIIRMAMDSTMLGSFCDETISSSFSNVLDDSIINKHEKSLSNESFRGRRTTRETLNFLNAKKVEISARDLEMAINDPN